MAYTDSPIEHGTTRGYQRHVKNPEKYGPPCEECQRAHADAIAEYRAEHGRGNRSTEFMRTRARRRALVRLGKMYPDDLDELIVEELRSEMESMNV